VAFIKSDTEGAEPLVIEGMQRTIGSAAKLALLLVYNPAALRCGRHTPEAFLERLRSFGLQVQAIAPDGSLGDIPELSGMEYVNLLCRKGW
jgi:hypothetical protein